MADLRELCVVDDIYKDGEGGSEAIEDISEITDKKRQPNREKSENRNETNESLSEIDATHNKSPTKLTPRSTDPRLKQKNVRKRNASPLNSKSAKRMAKDIIPKSDSKTNISDSKPIRPPEQFDLWEMDCTSTYGLSREVLKKLEIERPLTNWVQVENLTCEGIVARELFQRAGDVLCCDIQDQNWIKVMFRHPIEAVQAISMFNNQKYNGKELKVTMCDSHLGNIPKGMSSIGPGFGINGTPLRDVTRQMERRFKGYSSNVDEEIFEFSPSNIWKKSETDPIANENPHSDVSSPDDFNESLHGSPIDNKSQTSDKYSAVSPYSSISQDGSDKQLSKEDKSENPKLCKTQYSKQNEKKRNIETIGSSEKFPDKALVPQAVAEKIVAMIKKGWTAFDIVSVLNAADDQRKIQMVKPGLHVLAPNALNNMAVNQNINVNRPFIAGPSSASKVAGPIVGPSHVPVMSPSGPNKIIGNSTQMSGNSGLMIKPTGKNFGSVNFSSSMQGSSGLMGGQFGQVSGPVGSMSRTYGPGSSAPTSGSMFMPSAPTDPMPFTVELRNLPLTLTFQIIHEKMSMCGTVKFVRFTDPGCVLVGYSNAWEAEQCIQMFNKTVVEGHEVQVHYARGFGQT